MKKRNRERGKERKKAQNTEDVSGKKKQKKWGINENFLAEQKHEYNNIQGRSHERLYTNPLAAIYQSKILKIR